MILQEEAFRAPRVHRDFVDALPELGILAGHKHGADSPVLRRPSTPGVVGAINAAGGNRYVHALLVHGVEHDGVQRQSTVARHPAWPVRMIEQPAHKQPSFSRVAAFEESRWLNATVEDVGFIRSAERNLPDVLQREPSIRRKSNGGFLRIGPALAEILAGA